jgi:hypothetical protein
MATKEKETKVAETKQLTTEDFIKRSELKPKQKFINLDTGNLDQIEVKSYKYDLVPFDPKVHGTKEEYFKHAARYAAQLVHPIDKQVEAFLKYATSESYQAGKTAALQGGNFLTPEVKSTIGDILKAKTQFADLTKGECYERWEAGYKEKKPAALAILKQAQDMQEAEVIDL